MKVVILCGGLGTRLSEQTEIRPKPMVEIGGRPILWHLMRGYAQHGFNDFVLALGYKGEVIKCYFVDYCELQSRIVPDTIRSLLRGERPVVRSDGSYVRDYFYVKDCPRAYLRVAETCRPNRPRRSLQLPT